MTRSDAGKSVAVARIGSRLREIDWRSRTLRSASYVSAPELPSILHACVLRSPHPHAELISVDVAPALQSPGIDAALVAGDFPDRCYPIFHERSADRWPLAADKVRFIGDEVTALAADTSELARQALRARSRCPIAGSAS